MGPVLKDKTKEDTERRKASQLERDMFFMLMTAHNHLIANRNDRDDAVVEMIRNMIHRACIHYGGLP